MEGDWIKSSMFRSGLDDGEEERDRAEVAMAVEGGVGAPFPSPADRVALLVCSPHSGEVVWAAGEEFLPSRATTSGGWCSDARALMDKVLGHQEAGAGAGPGAGPGADLEPRPIRLQRLWFPTSGAGEGKEEEEARYLQLAIFKAALDEEGRGRCSVGRIKKK